METNKYLVPLSIIVAGALVAGAIYFGGGGGGTYVANPFNSLGSVEVPKVTEKDHILGSKEAPIVIVEYSDTECPFCKVFHNTLHDVVNSYEGKVSWVYRQFPIASLHSKATKEAEATECAAELGGNQAFWTYLDKIFLRTNSNDSLDPAELPKIAGEMGLDVAAFNSCLSSGKYTEFVTKSIEDAIKAGARGTPYSIIIAGDKKVVVNGAEPIESVRAKVDALLK
jgi:protein-disulfide isomerase